ncbi:hypothetical protein DPMN_000109 [Dreissena polymorpha]|uniref:Uncharacterized protein n=1 Tax=Dreissena polymorpha TaxID=45954 RepID=A0A9D4RRQ8_DREPO|nr:hypothetical protein DPMN_000109 [Dreissena polymorpha]
MSNKDRNIAVEFASNTAGAAAEVFTHVDGVGGSVTAHIAAPYYAATGQGAKAAGACVGMHGGLSGALIGGAVAGPVGALVGGIAGGVLVAKGTEVFVDFLGNKMAKI